MSFLDLATLTMHRQHELENRIHEFDVKCDRAINDIKNLKLKANGFTCHLNCDPSELKERFLKVMQKLDEYMYLITDFNLAMAQTIETSNADNPVQDTSVSFPQSLSPFNILDTLTEPRPAVSHACPNLCPPQDALRVKLPKEQQGLITFSSSSSAESVPTNVTPNPKQQSAKPENEVLKSKNGIIKTEKNIPKSKEISMPRKETPKSGREKRKLEKEILSELVDDMASFSVEPVNAEMSLVPKQLFKECCITSAQSILEVQVEKQYPATIMSVYGGSFWVITDESADVVQFMSEMTDYYERNKRPISAHELANMAYCALDRGGLYNRAMFLQKLNGHEKTVELYLVDTGEIVTISIDHIQPLVKQFCERPPYARFCHLAGIDLGDNENNKELMKKQDALINEYIGMPCTILVDDNTSESLGVFVILPSSNTTLNDLIVDRGLAVPSDKLYSLQSEPITAPPGFVARCSPERYQETSSSHDIIEPPQPCSYGPPPDSSNDEDDEMLANLDITRCPEFEDPVLAVTGYHNRDEADICKHYKGGPEKTCFKGARCTKKHILHHPDGWTLDKVEVVAKCKSLPLPAPGSWLKVQVPTVCHFDRIYIQIIEDIVDEGVPSFGVILPPMTLERLMHDMNSPATILSYERLTIAPAPGEMVAAIYPMDKSWYRARVLSSTRHDQSVEVMYVDYGTVLWVKEDQIRVLEERFMMLPIQAMQCVLGGVRGRGDSAAWGAARRALQAQVEEGHITVHVLAREYDEIIIDLYKYEDPADEVTAYNVAELLAQQQHIHYVPCKPQSDRNVTFKHVVP